MEPDTRALLDDYHELLRAGTLAAESAAVLAAVQERLGLYVGRRPVCPALRPRLLPPATYRRTRRAAEAMLPLVRAVYERAVADPVFRRQLRLRDWEEELFAVDPGYGHPVATSRMDGFVAPDGRVRFTEYNAETPAGAGYADALSSVFLGLPVMQEFARRHHVSPLPCRPGVLHAVLDAYRQWRGTSNEPPRVAIVDWREVPTLPEFTLVADYFKTMGVEARSVDPRELEYARGRLRAGDMHVTVVYKRVLLRELVEQGGPDHPLLRAARERAVCVVNSFRCRLLARKAIFAILTDERNEGMFSPAQLALVREHVPWTRVLEERVTDYHGEPIDLVPHVMAHPERFVLKPNDGFGGRGVIVGAERGPGWERAVVSALEEPWVVQERLEPTREPFPEFVGGELLFRESTVETGLFVTAGEYAHGGLARLSPGAVVGVAAGGGAALPLFLAEPR